MTKFKSKADSIRTIGFFNCFTVNPLSRVPIIPYHHCPSRWAFCFRRRIFLFLKGFGHIPFQFQVRLWTCHYGTCQNCRIRFPFQSKLWWSFWMYCILKNRKPLVLRHGIQQSMPNPCQTDFLLDLPGLPWRYMLYGGSFQAAPKSPPPKCIWDFSRNRRGDLRHIYFDAVNISWFVVKTIDSNLEILPFTFFDFCPFMSLKAVHQPDSLTRYLGAVRPKYFFYNWVIFWVLLGCRMT